MWRDQFIASIKTRNEISSGISKKGSNNDWVAYYEKVIGIKYFDFIDDGKGLHKLLNINGVLVNTNNDGHFVIAITNEIQDKTTIKEGFKLVSINGTDLKNKNQIDLINLLNIQKGKAISAKLLDLNGSNVDFKVSELKFDKKGVAIAITENAPKTISIIFVSEDKKIDIPAVIYLRSVDGQENLNFTLSRFEYEIERA